MTKVDEHAFVPVLDEELLATVTEAFRSEQSVQLAYLFGSQTTQRVSALSDIDLAVLFGPGTDRASVQDRLYRDLTAVLATYEIDLVDLTSASPLLKHRVITRGTLLLERDHLTKVRFEREALLHYLDTAPLRKTLTAGLKRQLGVSNSG